MQPVFDTSLSTKYSTLCGLCITSLSSSYLTLCALSNTSLSSRYCTLCVLSLDISLSFKLYYQQLQLIYLCNLARWWIWYLWRWLDSVETCRSMVIYKLIVTVCLLAILQNNKKCMVHVLKWNKITYIGIYCSLVSHTEVLNAVAESCGLIRVCYWSHTSSVDHSTVGEGMLIGDALLRMHSGEL